MKKVASILAAGLLGLALFAPRAEAVSAEGGTVTNYTDAGGTNWIAHIFTTVGTTSLTIIAGGNVEVLVVGGAAAAVRGTAAAAARAG